MGNIYFGQRRSSNTKTLDSGRNRSQQTSAPPACAAPGSTITWRIPWELIGTSEGICVLQLTAITGFTQNLLKKNAPCSPSPLIKKGKARNQLLHTFKLTDKESLSPAPGNPNPTKPNSVCGRQWMEQHIDNVDYSLSWSPDCDTHAHTHISWFYGGHIIVYRYIQICGKTSGGGVCDWLLGAHQHGVVEEFMYRMVEFSKKKLLSVTRLHLLIWHYAWTLSSCRSSCKAAFIILRFISYSRCARWLQYIRRADLLGKSPIIAHLLHFGCGVSMVFLLFLCTAWHFASA